MVCLGNICRSPVAEGVMRHLLIQNNVQAQVDSAGTANYHTGEAPDKRSQKSTLKHNIDISRLKARQFTRKDFQEFDLIFVMDQSNYQNVCKLANSAEEKNKVRLLLDVLSPGKKQEVPDPYYGDESDFEEVFTLVHSACSVIVETLIRHRGD